RTLEAALKQMTTKAVTPMKVMDVGPQQTGQQGRQLFWIAQLYQQVEMVGHQAPMIDTEAEALRVAADQGHKGQAILVVAEDGLAVVAAIQQVVASFLGPLP